MATKVQYSQRVHKICAKQIQISYISSLQFRLRVNRSSLLKSFLLSLLLLLYAQQESVEKLSLQELSLFVLVFVWH